METQRTTIRLTPLDPTVLPGLHALWREQMHPASCPDLVRDIQSGAHAHGKNAVIAWRDNEPVGCAGWVAFGIAQDGCAYGAPIFAADAETASVLIDRVCSEMRTAGAKRLRISTRHGEDAKREALGKAGFRPLFDFVHFSRNLPFDDTVPLPDGLHAVALRDIDWHDLHRCFAACFAGVPNAPICDVDALCADWSTVDERASIFVADDAGRCQAFLTVQDGMVDAVGIAHAWRGRNLAAALYHHAAAAFLARGETAIHVPLVASINTASMRMHHKLGFTESEPRVTVHELLL